MEATTVDQVWRRDKPLRKEGECEGSPVAKDTGHFGPYARHDDKYYSIPKDADPFEVTLDEAIKLIEEKREAERQKFIKSFDEEPELSILNGRFGPYISYQGKNYKIPKGIVPQDLNLQSCFDLIKLQNEKAESAPKKRKTTKAKK